MPSFVPDPELIRLVRDLNRGEAETAPMEKPEPSWEREETSVDDRAASFPDVSAGSRARLETLLKQMVDLSATDLHLVAGVPAAFRVNGEIRFDPETVLTNEEVRGMVPARQQQELKQRGAVDFAVAAGSGETRQFRFRVNVHQQRGVTAAALRMLPLNIPTLGQLNLPRSLGELTKASRGLVLVCGPTGSGKSTTLAALLGEINRTQAKHIITIEDPLEYEHKNAKSLVEQIEIGKDAETFAGALRSALRQDPDVILVGEMRDLETVSIALTAAETGHLIFSTLHTSSPAQSINRIVDVYPSNQQPQIYKQIALSLNAVLHQKLIPRADGRGVVPAAELLLANIAVRHQVRSGKLEGLHNEITLGKRLGMFSFDDSLRELVGIGLITRDEALARANEPEELRRVL
jgi:twitching motility protein PilT